jgi:hypothetical protein
MSNINPFARPAHTWDCARYCGGEAPCDCFAIQCAKCRAPQRSDRRPCWCLAAEIEEEARWSDWEAYREDERRMLAEANPVSPVDEEREVEANYNYWINRGYEREQQLSDASKGWK